MISAFFKRELIFFLFFIDSKPYGAADFVLEISS